MPLAYGLLVPRPGVLRVSRPVARPAPQHRALPPLVPSPASALHAASAAEEKIPFPQTTLGIGLIITALVLQSAGASLLARRVALRHSYDGAVAGLMQEAVKVPLGFACLAFYRDVPLKQRLQRFGRAYTDAPRHVPRLAIPAGCFAAQNVLFYYAHARLPATVYLSLSQSKTLFTALFSVALLNRRLSRTQWASQPLLMGGCVLVLMQSMAGSTMSSAGSAAVVAGAAACLVSGLLSGFANVFFEKILKKRAIPGDDAGFWARQLQLSLVTFLFVLPLAPGDWIAKALIFPRAVWAVVFLKAVGGLLIGATIKYASAISKNFASAVAIVLTAAISREARLSATFRGGILAVVASMVMFQAFPPKQSPESSAPS